MSEAARTFERLALKSGVFFGRSEDGAIFRGGGAPVVLRGRKAYELARALLNGLEQGMPVPALLGQLPETVRPVAARLIQDLETNDLLSRREAGDADWEGALDPRFANLWTFIADNCERPGDAMRRWQDTRFSVSGDAVAAGFVVRALAETAARHIVLNGKAAAVDARVTAAFEQEFPELSLTREPDDHYDSVRAAEIAIHAAGDAEHSGDAPEREGLWYLGRIAGHLAVAHIAETPTPVLARWADALRPPSSELIAAHIPDQRIALAAAGLAFAALGRQAGLDVALASDRPYVIEPNANFRPIEPAPPVRLVDRTDDPRNFTVGEARTKSPAPSFAAPEDDEAAAAAVERDEVLFHPLTGILEQIDEDVPQIPLSVTRVEVRSARDRSLLGSVRGWGLTAPEARERAIARALLLYASSAPVFDGVNGTIGVAADVERARANAEAASAGSTIRLRLVSDDESVPEFAEPEVHKLRRLLTMISDEPIAIELGRSDSAPCVCVRVSAGGTVLAEARAPGGVEALCEALGEACVASVLGRDDTVAQMGFAMPLGSVSADQSDPADIARVIDIGFPTVEPGYALVWSGAAR